MSPALPEPPHPLRNLTIGFVAVGLTMVAAILAVGTGIDLIGWAF